MGRQAIYEHYQSYTPSDISWLGEIPSDWSLSRIRSHFQIVKRIAGELGHDVLSITQRGIKKKDIESGEGQLASDYSKYQIVKAGNFAMNHMDLLTGYVDISAFNGVTSPDYRVFRLTDSSCEPRYWLYFFQLCYKERLFFPFGQGAAHLGRWRLPTEEFNDFPCVVPSLEEQQKIAQFLDHETAKIDTLISQQQKLIELLKEKRQAVISHAVTKGLNPDAPMKDSGVEWLGEIPEGWVVAGFTLYLESIVDYRGKTPTKVDDGVFLVTARNIKSGKIDYSLSQEFIPLSEYEKVMSRGIPLIGDVLFTTEAPLGEVAEVDRPDIALAQRIVKFRGRKHSLDNKFLKYFIMSDQFQYSLIKYATGSTALGIKAARLNYLRIAFPSVNTQAEISSHIEKEMKITDNLLSKASDAIELLKERKSSLISSAVTGKIDVRNWQPPEPTQ